jgi:hypothetical protein
MKRTPFRRKTALKAKTGLKNKTALRSKGKPKSKNKVSKKRTKLPTARSVQKRCDLLLTPIIKAMYPYCLLTGAPTEVAHHHVKKSESNALRYYLPNLIPLTHKAHMALHSHETIYSSKIVAIKGLAWWNDLEREKQRPMKCDVHYYLAEEQRLKDILAKLN